MAVDQVPDSRGQLISDLAQAMRDANSPAAWASPQIVPFDHFARVALDWIEARRPSDETLVRGSAITAWLYVDASLDHVQMAITSLRERMKAELRGDDPFGQLLTAVDQERSRLGGAR